MNVASSTNVTLCGAAGVLRASGRLHTQCNQFLVELDSLHKRGVQTEVMKGSPHLHVASTNSVGYPMDVSS